MIWRRWATPEVKAGRGLIGREIMIGRIMIVRGGGVGVRGVGITPVDPVHSGGSGNGRNVEPECADGEESDNGFGEHDDGECRKREQRTTAPGLRLERFEEETGESCTAAEETRERTSTVLCIPGNRGRRYGSDISSSFSPLDTKTNTVFFPSRLSHYFQVRHGRDDLHLHI